MEEIFSSETSVLKTAMRRHIQEESILHFYRCEIIKNYSYMINLTYNSKRTIPFMNQYHISFLRQVYTV
jgi:hypothetical protein